MTDKEREAFDATATATQGAAMSDELVKRIEEQIQAHTYFHNRLTVHCFEVCKTTIQQLTEDKANSQAYVETLWTEKRLLIEENKRLRAEIERLKAQSVPPGWKLVPIDPTEEMVIRGFESNPKHQLDEDAQAKYKAMSGCEKAAWTARECYKAMLQAAPTPGEQL